LLFDHELESKNHRRNTKYRNRALGDVSAELLEAKKRD